MADETRLTITIAVRHQYHDEITTTREYIMPYDHLLDLTNALSVILQKDIRRTIEKAPKRW